MKRLLAAAAAIALLATSAQAGSKPTLPKEFHGQWCQTENSNVLNLCAAGDIAMDRHGFGTEDSYCKLLSVRPQPSGKYGTVNATFKCTNYIDREATTYHYQIGRHLDNLMMWDRNVPRSAAHARSPELPTPFRGYWCNVADHSVAYQPCSQYHASHLPEGGTFINSKGIHSTDRNGFRCWLRHLTPQMPSRREHEYRGTLRCISGIEAKGDKRENWTAYYWIGFYSDDYMIIEEATDATFSAVKN